jgi:hypothetical protein
LVVASAAKADGPGTSREDVATTKAVLKRSPETLARHESISAERYEGNDDVPASIILLLPYQP